VSFPYCRKWSTLDSPTRKNGVLQYHKCVCVFVCAHLVYMYACHPVYATLTESTQSGQYQSPAGTSSRLGCENTVT